MLNCIMEQRLFSTGRKITDMRTSQHLVVLSFPFILPWTFQTRHDSLHSTQRANREAWRGRHTSNTPKGGTTSVISTQKHKCTMGREGGPCAAGKGGEGGSPPISTDNTDRGHFLLCDHTQLERRFSSEQPSSSLPIISLTVRP